ncbi:MAG: hypothetical protein ACYCUV_14785, partial [Phycisphaerae bacterium]
MRLTEFSLSRTQWHKHNKFPAQNGTRFHRINQPETCHTRYDGNGNVLYDNNSFYNTSTDAGDNNLSYTYQSGPAAGDLTFTPLGDPKAFYRGPLSGGFAAGGGSLNENFQYDPLGNLKSISAVGSSNSETANYNAQSQNAADKSAN